MKFNCPYSYVFNDFCQPFVRIFTDTYRNKVYLLYFVHIVGWQSIFVILLLYTRYRQLSYLHPFILKAELYPLSAFFFRSFLRNTNLTEIILEKWVISPLKETLALFWSTCIVLFRAVFFNSTLMPGPKRFPTHYLNLVNIG